MDINQLKYALAVLKAGSIKKAAGELYVSQPYLSKVIKSLEDELGFPLFFRTSRGVLPTRDGTVFLQKAKKVTQSLSQLESSYKKDFTPVTSISLIKSPFSVTKRQNEGILKQVIDSGDTLTELHVTDGSVSQVIQAVKNGECKIGVLRFLQKNEKAVKSFFSDNQLVCVEIARPELFLSFGKKNTLISEGINFDLKSPFCEVSGDDSYLIACPKGEYKMQVKTKVICSSEKTVLTYLKSDQRVFSFLDNETIENAGLFKYEKKLDAIDCIIFRQSSRFNIIENKLIAVLSEK